MSTLKNIFITIPGKIDSKSLYKELKNYKMNVTDLISRVYVYGVIDLAEPMVEYIIQICYKYGPVKIEITDVANMKAPD